MNKSGSRFPQIRVAISNCKSHFRLIEVLPGGPKDAEVSKYLKGHLGSPVFCNRNIAIKAQESLNALTTAYVFDPKGSSEVRSTGVVKEDDLRNVDIAKYIFSPGDGYGSYKDLVVGTHGMTFPMPADKELYEEVWKKAKGQSGGCRRM